MIKPSTARRIAIQWHGGPTSALYHYGSTGTYTIENHLRYLQEIERDLHPEYYLHPGELSKKDERELNALKDFFIEQGMDNGILTEWEKNEQYGYMVPYLHNDCPEEIACKVRQIYYMK